MKISKTEVTTSVPGNEHPQSAQKFKKYEAFYSEDKIICTFSAESSAVGRGNDGIATLKSGRPCTCQNCSRWSPSEKTGRGSLLNRPLDDLIGRGTELNCLGRMTTDREMLILRQENEKKKKKNPRFSVSFNVASSSRLSCKVTDRLSFLKKGSSARMCRSTLFRHGRHWWIHCVVYRCTARWRGVYWHGTPKSNLSYTTQRHRH